MSKVENEKIEQPISDPETVDTPITAKQSRGKSLFWKISSHFQLIGVITLIITLAVTLETSVSLVINQALL